MRWAHYWLALTDLCKNWSWTARLAWSVQVWPSNITTAMASCSCPEPNNSRLRTSTAEERCYETRFTEYHAVRGSIHTYVQRLRVLRERNVVNQWFYTVQCRVGRVPHLLPDRNVHIVMPCLGQCGMCSACKRSVCRRWWKAPRRPT